MFHSGFRALKNVRVICIMRILKWPFGDRVYQALGLSLVSNLQLPLIHLLGSNTSKSIEWLGRDWRRRTKLTRPFIDEGINLNSVFASLKCASLTRSTSVSVGTILVARD